MDQDSPETNGMNDPVLLQEATEAIARAKTKEDVVEAWRQHYLKIGHKRLGRILLGKDPTHR